MTGRDECRVGPGNILGCVLCRLSTTKPQDAQCMMESLKKEKADEQRAASKQKKQQEKGSPLMTGGGEPTNGPMCHEMSA